MIAVEDSTDPARFGPQTEAIEALLVRAETLTPDGAESLGAAWDAVRYAALDATWDTARDAARDAAQYAGRAAAWYAAWDAAWDAVRYAALDAGRDAGRAAGRAAAWYAARDAAWDAVRYAALDAVWYKVWYAVRALVVRDLIGQHGLTQAHYDILTGPWATTIGPVHPDDPDRKTNGDDK